ncbi:hypothetical protein H4S02_010046, partial [Coemansia sp. RSA 2611]
SAAIPADTYRRLQETAKANPLFVLPLPRADQGVEFFLLQFDYHQVHFTSLAEYKVHTVQSRPVLTLTHYTDLMDCGIVLMRGELDPENRTFDVENAQLLALLMQLFYVSGGPQKRALLETFNHRPAEFDYAQLIEAAQTLTGNDEEQPGMWPVTALGFDTSSEILYTGDTSGQLTTYGLGGEGEELEQLASVQCAHTPVRRLYAAKAGRVFVQTDDSVQVRTSGGRKCFGRTTTPNDAFTASTVSASGGEALVFTSAGAGSLLNLELGSVTHRMSVEPSVVAADYRPNGLLLATAAGDIVLRDPRAGFQVSFAKRAAFGAGPGCHATDMVRAVDSRVFACGSLMAGATDYADSGAVVRLFDIRKLGEPVLDLEPEYGHVPVRLYSDDQLLWICHDSGLLTTRSLAGDVNVAPPPAEAYAEPPLSTYAYMSAFGVAPSGSVAVVSDTDGILHVWSDSTEPFMSTGTPADLYAAPAVLDDDGPLIDDESVSLSSIGMGAPVKSPLLSCMDSERLYDVGRPVAYVESRVLGSLKQMGAVGYAPNPRTQHRNQQPFASTAWRQSWRSAGGPAEDDDDELTRGRPKFISEQLRSRRRQEAGSARASSRSGDPATDATSGGDQQPATSSATTALAPS